MNFLQSYTLPVSNNIKRFKETDFALETRDKICIYDDACNIVYFYTESPDSRRVLGIFKAVAESVAGPSFAACNVLLEKGVATAFMEISNIKDHPFHWATTRPFPFIIVYRKGYPINFYDGPADVAIMANFCMNVANMDNFHIRNEALSAKIRNEMWIEYRMKNPLIIGPTPEGVAPQGGPKPVYIPAIPYRERKEIE
jgi:hypothetical protein